MNTIILDQVTKNYGRVQGISNVTLSIEPGVTGILGPNGAGKSTLLKLLANVIKPSFGQIKIGEEVKIAYYAQHQLELLDKGKSVFESIASLSYGKSDTEIRTYLGSFLFSGEDIEKKIEVLSGGEKARVALARMLIEPVDL